MKYRRLSEANNGVFFIFSKKKEGSGGEERTRLKSLGEQFHSDEEDGEGGGGEADDRQPLTASRDTAVVVAANTSVNAQGES